MRTDRSRKSATGRSRAPAGVSTHILLKSFSVVICSAFLVLMSACALKASKGGIPPEVQAVIDTVSNDIADGKYEKIYSEAAEEWREAATPEQSAAIFKSLKDRLGNIKSRSYHSATEQDSTSGHSFVIAYRVSFDRAEGMETFTLVEREGRWQLARYVVNSDALK